LFKLGPDQSSRERLPELAPDHRVWLAVDGSLQISTLREDGLVADQSLRQGLLPKLHGAVDYLMQMLNGLRRKTTISLGVHL